MWKMEWGRKEKREGSSLSDFLDAFIHYAFHRENYAQVQSLFEGYDSFTEWGKGCLVFCICLCCISGVYASCSYSSCRA